MVSSWVVDTKPNRLVDKHIKLASVYVSFLRRSFPDLFLVKLNNSLAYLRLYSIFYNKCSRQHPHPIKRNPLYTNFLDNDFKLEYRNIQSSRRLPQPNRLVPVSARYIAPDLKLFTIFKSYLKLNSASQGTISTPHASFTQFYLGYRRGGLAVLNVSRLYSRWKEVYYLLFNLFYYELDLLTFSSSFFKHEVLALNWQFMAQYKFMWRYTQPFLTLRSTKINIYGDFVFYRLNLLGLNVALVTDVLYHAKTIYYLHRARFYTVGLVPVNYNLNTVDFAIPSASDSILGQVFFLRFLSLTQQNVSESRYSSLKSFWFKHPIY